MEDADAGARYQYRHPALKNPMGMTKAAAAVFAA